MAPYIDSRDFPHSQSIKDTSIASRYWEERFNSAGSQSRLACLPVDYQWPRAETTAVASNGLLKAAMRFCYTHNTSVEDLIYAAWAIVSARQAISSGPVTTVFTIAGRRSTVTLNGDNAYDYHYPLVLSVPEDLDVLSCIRTVGTAAASAASHSYIEYEQIMEIGAGVRPQVKLSVMFSDDNHDTMAPDDDRFPLLFNIYVSEDLKLTMRHNATVPRADIRVLLDRFAITLQRMTENSRANVSSIDVMLPSEMQLLLDYGKAAFKPRSGLVHRLVEEQANLKPDAAAVQFEADPPLTYAVLNRRSNQLACQLRQHSASYIAVHMRVCADFIVAVLAILKSGAAYVILDPDAPVSRKAFILDDLQPGMVLADHSTAGELEKEIQLEVLLSQSFSHDPADLMLDQDPSSVAYVIYTSGSTGHPKSVLLEHQAAFNGLLAFPPVENLRQLLFFNPAFSAAQRSIWATLSVGGCLCLASKENLTVHTAKMIHIMDVNAVDMTPSAAALISPGDVPSLRRMVLGGDMINPAIIRTWEHRVKLFSSYGLSECTQLNWRYRLNTNASSRMIGQPYDTTTSYILHPGSTQLSPLLVPGELCLGGAQLAKGYLNRPDETAKRFIRNAFGKGRLYRTGDLAVRHADGSVEMIGRIDFQVKINGHRVDPGEPRSIIQAVEEVEDSAVVPASLSNRTVLVAAVVSRVDADWDALVGKLRSLLSARLPLYMVPSFWVPMSALPINTNGKTDMMAIREMVERLGESGQLLPERSHQDSAESSLTKNEKIVRSLWSKYLSLAESDISLEDSFISLGGSSLEAIQVVSQLQSVHGLSLQVRDILLGTSLSQVAGSVQRQVATEEKNDTDDPTSSALSRVAPSVEDLGITISEVEDAFFVTPFQEAAIANTLLGGTSYIYSRSYSFEGYSSDNVKVAFETLMQSDGCLRTTFVPDGLTFLQLVRKSASIPWETSNMDVAEYMQQQVSKTMQPGELWWRVAVFPNNILVITAHHALFDFWSNEFLIEDIGLELQGVLRVQRGGFRRFAEYLRQHDEVVMQNFWQQYLDGAVPSSLGSQAAVLESTVTAEAHCDLKGTASQRGVTPGVLLYAAWAVVLGLANSTDDVVMGVTISGRDAPVPGILQMSGPTLMVAPLRIKVDNTSSLDELCKNVQLNLWGVARNAPYGLRKIFKASGQSKALFDTMANFLLKIPTAPGGLRPMPESNLGTVEYTKLELRNDSLNRVTLTSTLEPLYAQALVDTLVAVLKTASDAPFTEIGAFEQVPRVRGKLNGSEADEPDDSQVHIHEIEDQIKNPSDFQLGHSALQKTAASHPGRTAVEDLSGARITYAGLVIKMNQLAGILREKGVMLEQVVPIMLQKSINTVVAMFGILVAGGAFLPLDPETPRERNLGILEDCSTKLVITDTQNAGFFKETSYEVVIIDVVAWDTLPLQRQIVPELNPDSLAYVIYTSGSTGKPKGTLIPHSAIVAAVEGILNATSDDNSRRVLWSLNYTFDGSYYPVFPTLSTGRTLCVAPQNVIVGNLAEIITYMRIDQTNLTPTMASLIHPDDVPTLEILATGGEPVTHNMLNVWAPRLKVYTSYGPTEATICVTTRVVTPDMNIRNVGSPFPSTTALILDPDTAETLSSGSIGELCIAGPQLARGYLNRPDATEKVFQDDSYQRFYRTGDLARLLPSGEIELFGRKDDQVKINGYRMELGEVESVITQTNIFNHCAVIAATVLKKKQLVAFYSSSVQTPGEELGQDLLLPPTQLSEVDQVKSRLTTLPQYMVPTIWLPVSKLPSLTSGKIDRKRLTTLVEGMTDSSLKRYLTHNFQPSEPNTETEKELQLLWSTLFETPAEEIHANSTFHALGGDSISALSLNSMLRRRGYKIQVQDLLSRSTLREQAALMVNVQQDVDRIAAEPAQQLVYHPSEAVYERLAHIGVLRGDVEDIYPCSPGQIEFFVQGQKTDQFWQLMAVRTLPTDLDFDRWIYLATKLTKQNQILRALYLQTDPMNPQTLVQVVLRHPVLNLTYRSYRTDEEKQSILEAEWQRNFDPAKPFVRYTLLEDPKGIRDLVINLHHSSYDGTLLHIFDDQFIAFNKNQPIEQPTPFKDFITYFLNTPKQPQLDYWTDLLQNHTFNFPSTLKDPKVSNIEVAKIEASLGVNELAGSAGVTAPIVFQAAYSLLLAHLSGGACDVIYDNLVTGRNVPLDSPQLINGNLANFLPFHAHVAGDMPIETLLRSTQDDFWASTENGLVSLDEIYEALGRDRVIAAAKCLFCFQPFEPVTTQQDPMRWIVMKMSKNRMNFNYAIQMEVVKAAAKGEYVVRFCYDNRVFSFDEARTALRWYTRCLEDMAKRELVRDLGI